MTRHYVYKGYLGSAEVDIESGTLHGKLLFIRDVVSYAATTPIRLEKAFVQAVDQYLSDCERFGDKPDLPCKGSFNVRIKPDLHRDLAVTARKRRISLNEAVEEAVSAYLAEAQAHLSANASENHAAQAVKLPYRSR